MPVLSLPGTPDLLGLHAQQPERYPVLLETASGGGWDILFAFPENTLLFDVHAGTDFFARCNAVWNASRAESEPAAAHLPFRGGWFVYLGYELLHALEPCVLPRPENASFPGAALMRAPAALMVDRRTGAGWLFAEQDSAHLLDEMKRDLASQPGLANQSVSLQELVEEPEQDFLDGVARIKRYIRDGDVFQVNLSRRWHGRLHGDNAAGGLYAALRGSNPAPFAGIARLTPACHIVSSSPERLVRLDAGMAYTRPIAGTYPRHPDPRQDAQTRADLAAHPKERAEHVMLVDLERNDLGRVCVPGSIRVEELMAVASYAHVHHIESTVQGRLRDGVSPLDAIRALFPGGTITGCPKVRTMQIIRELESSPRHAYTGSMGYLNRDGDLDLNILIRTIMVEDNRIRFSAGAGIVADSDPQRELNETRAKAKGLLRALGLG